VSVRPRPICIVRYRMAMAKAVKQTTKATIQCIVSDSISATIVASVDRALGNNYRNFAY